MLWQSARATLNNEDFREGKLKQVAKDISNQILLVLDVQYSLLGATASRAHRKVLNKIVFDALVLKARLRASPDYYDLEWVRSGRELDRESMDEYGMSEGRREVLWCVAPGVRVRKTVDRPWEIAVPPQVVTQPWPENNS